MPNYSGLMNANANASGLMGLADGLRSALGSFREGRKDARDEEETALNRQMKDKMYSIEVAKSGLEEGADEKGHGLFHMAPSYVAQKKADREEQWAYEQQKIEAEKQKELAVKREEAKGLGGLLKNFQLMDAIKKANDPYENAPALVKEQAKGLTEANTKRESGLLNLKSVLSQLEDPKLPEDQKITAGQGAIKWLNDPMNPDAVGAQEANRIGGRLEQFQLGRPGAPLGVGFGRDLPGFTEQLRNKALALEKGKFGAQDQIAGLLKQPLQNHESNIPQKGGVKSVAPKAGEVRDGYKFKGGDPAKKENWEKQ